MLKKLVDKLTKQADGKDVRILWMGDNRSMSLGIKRLKMYYASIDTEYITFIDDDDDVSNDYVDSLLYAIEQHPVDLINFKMLYTNGRQQYEVRFGSKLENKNYKNYFERTSHTLMCWRWAVIHPKAYSSETFGEDTHYAVEMSPRVQSEFNIDKILYFYNYNRDTSTQPHL